MSNIVKEMKLSVGSQCVKYLMFVFNLLFVITGIILLSIGVVIHGIYNGFEHFLDSKFFSATSLLIAIGALIFFIAFFGCCGAVRENYCMIVTFTSLLVIVFILELSAGISGYVLRARAMDVIEGRMNDTMNAYVTDKEIQGMWDTLQKEFKCCGTVGPDQWLPILNSTIPFSCCDPATGSRGAVNCTVDATDILHGDGCVSQVLGFVKGHAVQIGGAGITVAFVQALGIWFSIYLARSIRNSYETV